MGSTVIVDDSDSHQVQYNPQANWQQKGKPTEFRGTTMFSNQPNDSATFTFVGTSVSVYGTVEKGDGGENLAFTIEGSTGLFVAPHASSDTYHQLIFASATLEEGSHTLSIIHNSTGHPPTIDLDYFLYNTTSTAGKTVFIDDSDPRIRYESGWEQRVDNNSFQHTNHASQSAGAVLSFTFEGSSISFNGLILPNVGLNASVVIDEAAPLPITSQGQKGPTENSLLFSSSELTPGNHTIVITTLNDHPLIIDYFLVQAGAASSSDSTSTSILTSTPLPQATMPVPQHAVNSKSPLIPAVIGGSVTLLLILVLGLFGMLWWRRRARRNKKDQPSFITLKHRRQSELSVATLTNEDAQSRHDNGEFSKPQQPPHYIYYDD
ncbi:hypothetical protein B0H13DRAFT_2350915 [Mycena leptocephala]|nr:hypothetical protein B0H13DRAFT_2350915 [Mycena leptocephala]